MAKDCIFCKIIKGSIPSEKIYENEKVFAFLDINPIHHGHALVIPKKHAESLIDIDDTTLKELILAVKKVAKAVDKATGAHGFNIGMNNRAAAGQLVMHAHFHIIPRFEGDGLKTWERKVYDNRLKEYGEKIRKLL